MGKKNKANATIVTPVQKKTSFIDKLKFMQKNKKPQDKKDGQKASNIVSKTPINVSSQMASMNFSRTDLPNFFMKVQGLVIKNANNTKVVENQQSNNLKMQQSDKEGMEIGKEKSQSKIEYESWEKDNKDSNNQANQENENLTIENQEIRRFNFT